MTATGTTVDCEATTNMLRMLKMRDTYSVAEAQSRLSRLLRAAEHGQPVRIRRRDKTVAYLISRERMEAIAETLEILANPDAMRAISKHRRGKLKMFPLTALGDD